MIIEYIIVGERGGLKVFGWDGEGGSLQNLKANYTSTGTYEVSWDTLANQPGVTGTVNAPAGQEGNLTLNLVNVTKSSMGVVIKDRDGTPTNAEFTCMIMQ